MLSKPNDNFAADEKDIEISMDDGKRMLSYRIDGEEVEISREGKDESAGMNESGPQTDYIKKLLNHYKAEESNLEDESDNIEMEVHESIKKTQMAYQQILEQRKAREQKMAMVVKNEETKEQYEVDEKALEKALGFSESSQSDEDKEEINDEIKVDEAVSETSEDDFPLNKIAKTNNVQNNSDRISKKIEPVKNNQLEFESERKSEEIPVKDDKKSSNFPKKDSQLNEKQMTINPSLTTSKDFMEDTMCKLVKYLDTEESEKSSIHPDNNPSSPKLPPNPKEHTFGSSPPSIIIPSQKTSKLPPKNCRTERNSVVNYPQAVGGHNSARSKGKNLPNFGSEISPIGGERGIEDFMREVERSFNK